MTGEITLQGKALPISGIKEKILSAHLGGIKTILFLDTMSETWKKVLMKYAKQSTIIPVDTAIDALKHAILQEKEGLSIQKTSASQKSFISEFFTYLIN